MIKPTGKYFNNVSWTSIHVPGCLFDTVLFVVKFWSEFHVWIKFSLETLFFSHVTIFPREKRTSRQKSVSHCVSIDGLPT